jgi:hypothetical protein
MALMGTCIPNWPPSWFKKNKKIAPIINRMEICPINFSGFPFDPAKSRIKISTIIPAITTVGFNKKHPLFPLLYYPFYERIVQKEQGTEIRGANYNLILIFLCFASLNKKKYFASADIL